MNSAVTFLQGKKTYVILIALAALYVLEAIVGIDIPGVEVTRDEVLARLGEVAALMAMRAGITTAASK